MLRSWQVPSSSIAERCPGFALPTTPSAPFVFAVPVSPAIRRGVDILRLAVSDQTGSFRR